MMRPPFRIPRFLVPAALAAAAFAPAPAGASEGDVPALAATFANGAGGWVATSSCAPLCSVANTIDPGPGASDPGSATVIYTTLAGLLGGLASGTSTWTSPSFTWTGAAPDHATVSLARKASISGLLSVGGSASCRIQLEDLTSGALATVADESISTADPAFVTRTMALDPSLLKAAHSYRLRLTTNLSAAALLSGIRVAYDDVRLSGTTDAPATGNESGGDGGTTGTGGGNPAVTSPKSGSAPSALRLLAPAGVRFTRGRPLTVRVRATRAGKAAGHLVITLRVASTARRITTGRDGTASFTLTLRGRRAARITFRAGAAVATTWARPR
jgi:hypothetical protein